jgi:PAS domain S-box-containing protein
VNLETPELRSSKCVGLGRPLAATFGILTVFHGSPLAAQGAPPTVTGPLPELAELIWALVFISGLVVAATIWVAVLRRASRRQLETIRQREQALHEHYQDLFENAHDILFAHDIDGQLTALNRAGEQILGYPREEAVRMKFTQLIVPEDRAAYFHVIEQLRAGTDRGHVEVSATAKAGHRVVLRINVRCQNLPGRPAQILGIAWDITQRRQAEEALRQSEHQLRRSLEERIRIGRDLHDGIIQSIYAVGLGLGECRRLVHDSPPAEQRLERCIAELNSVIRDVRNFIGGLEPEALKGHEFGSALKSIATSLGDGVSAQFTLEIDPGAVGRLSDHQAAHLLQIAREAMTNALRHGRAGRVDVALQCRGHALDLRVRDDGTGFDPALVSGSGLGLKNIHGRVREMGGHCELLSDPGHGTQLKIELPAANIDDDRFRQDPPADG